MSWQYYQLTSGVAISHRAIINQEIRSVAELYFEGDKKEAIIDTVNGAITMERWTSLGEGLPGVCR